MECQLVVKDFKKIKSAKVTVKGFTVLSAANGHGKSTLFDSIVKILDNDFSDDYCRHGTDSYLIGIKLNEDDSQSVVCKREKSTNYLSFNNAPFISKLGRAGMNQVLPEFKLRRVDYESVKIYPNFALQGKIPMFEDISPTELLSSLYSDVFRISKKTNDSKKDITSKKEEVNKINSQILYLQEQANQVKDSLSELDEGAINYAYERYQHYSEIQDKVVQCEKDIAELNLSDEFVKNCERLESLVPLALEHKDEYEHYKQLKPVAERLTSLKDQLVSVNQELSKITISDDSVDLFVKGSRINVLKQQLDLVNQELVKFSNVNESLINPISNFVLLQKKQTEIASVRQQIVETDKQLSEVKASFAGQVCPTVLQLGSCPFNR